MIAPVRQCRPGQNMAMTTRKTSSAIRSAPRQYQMPSERCLVIGRGDRPPKLGTYSPSMPYEIPQPRPANTARIRFAM